MHEDRENRTESESPATRIRVLIVEDSRVVREYLRALISRDLRLEVAAAVGSAEDALRILDEVAPDVITMDIRLPGMNGFRSDPIDHGPACQHLIVVVSASVEAEDLQISMNALRAGAVCVMEKPTRECQHAYDQVGEALCTRLALMSQVRVVKQRIDRGCAIWRSGNRSRN